MPNYIYECKSCGTRGEQYSTMSNIKHIKCEECSGKVNIIPQLVSVNGMTSSFWAKGTQGGEGYSSVQYSKEEADIRIKNNLGKYDKI